MTVGQGARNFQSKKVFGEHTRPCGTCGSCEPFAPHATFYEEPYDIGKVNSANEEPLAFIHRRCLLGDRFDAILIAAKYFWCLQQRKLCRTCFIVEFPGYASKCAPVRPCFLLSLNENIRNDSCEVTDVMVETANAALLAAGWSCPCRLVKFCILVISSCRLTPRPGFQTLACTIG